MKYVLDLLAMSRIHCSFFNVWLMVRLEVYFCIINQHDALFFSLYCVTTCLHVSGPFVAHHQEAKFIM
jgi:hypothetical protein